jgi:alpha-tubulin suppressor-like RCC1 family protein
MIPRILLSLSILLMVALTTASAQLRPLDPWWIVTSYATELSAGMSHTCMIDTCGQVQCWGRNDFGQASPPALPGTCSLLQVQPRPPIFP